ncbi:MAG TPA: hypothetical protein PKH77_00525 [Anaerolineae bacterium]|nr:hypothetical protein [Anaerolineae bacterium]
MSWKDRENPIKDSDGPSYPFIQVVNNGQNLDPRAKNGKFALVADYGEVFGAALEGSEIANLVFRSGDATPVFVTDKLTFAPVVTRFAWIKDGNRLHEYVEGARGKLQVVGYFKGEDGGYHGPAMITATGTNSKEASDAIKAHKAAVNKATKGQASGAYFGMQLQMGETRLVGSGSNQNYATPIALVKDLDPDRDYVGDAIADDIEARHPEFLAWREAWKGVKGGPNGDGEVPGTEEAETAPVATKPASAPGAPAKSALPAGPASVPATDPYAAALPFNSTKYPGGTIRKLYDAGDEAALKATVDWCGEKPEHVTVKTAAEAALKALQAAKTTTATPF